MNKVQPGAWTYLFSIMYIGSASDNGDAESARYLGLIFLGGKGVASDSKKAIEWFSWGADRGDSLAAKNIKSLQEIY